MPGPSGAPPDVEPAPGPDARGPDADGRVAPAPGAGAPALVVPASGPAGARGWPARHAAALAAGLLAVVVTALDGPRALVLLPAALAGGALTCALLLRWGVWRWLAAAASLPVLLGATTGAPGLAGPPLTAAVAAALLALGWRARQRRALLLTLLGAAALAAACLVAGAAAWRPAAGEPAGPGLALAAAVPALLALAGAGRARRSGLLVACLLLTAPPVAALVGAATAGAAVGRDQVPLAALLPVAGALGLTALLRGRRSPSAERPQADDVDAAALADVRARYGAAPLAPVVVVIAAYDEAAGIGRVLDALPTTVAGLPADVLVVDDGSTDGTADVVRAHPRARVVACPVNRGQGAALRLGYRVAREGGARYVVTTDADGQYDARDLPVVLAPLLDGTADFVTGSRLLGRQPVHDRVRRAGTHVFAWAVRLLTGARVTDTSFGLRAVRAEVTAAVTLNQPQYQSSELLLGVLSHGYRVAEVPGRMHVRSNGSSKKGRNLVYGRRYAGVVLGTWWREGAPAPAGERAPARR